MPGANEVLGCTPIMDARRQVQGGALAPPLNFAVQKFFLTFYSNHQSFCMTPVIH